MRTAKPLTCLLAIGLFLSANLSANLSLTRAAVYQSAAVQIAMQPVQDGLSQPVLVTNAGDGSRRLFIAELTGAIKVLQSGESQATLFLDISSKVLIDRLGGFLGVAFHPQFGSNGRFFVHYLRRDDHIITAEYRVSNANPNIADANSEKVLIAQPKTRDGHMGGSIAFSPEGFLYVGLGDGFISKDPYGDAQNIESLLGKILRIDVDNPSGSLNYSSPSTNPFYGSTPGRDEIYALGFRNPYRFSVDRDTGNLYVGDVGEANTEEVNLVTAGGNYGWRVLEGTGCTNLDPALCNTIRSIAPIAAYTHENGRCSVTGGYVYRGRRSTFPQGAYIFGDLCGGQIFMLQNGVRTLLLDSGLFLASFGEDEDGELYAVDIKGSVYRIVTANPEEPVVQLTAPNVKMKLKGNSVYNITWTTAGSGIYRNDIQWSSDGGQSWEDVVGGLAGSVRSYAWTVPNIQSKRVRLRVISYGSLVTGQDESDENFVIKPRSSN
jgi:glucose/arabinose dehydrogenase